MSKLVSPAGDMEVTITGIRVDKNQMHIDGRLGVWDSQLYFTVDDVAHMLRLVLNLSVILFILCFPVLYVRERLFGAGTK